MGENPETGINNKEDKSPKLEQAIRDGERWLIRINGALLVVTIIIAAIYCGQLIQMRIATKAARDAAIVAKQSADLQLKIAEGSQAAWLIPSALELNRNFLSFGVQNMGDVPAENILVNVQVTLLRTSDNQSLWTESFAFEPVKYLAPKKNTNDQGERMLPKYTRENLKRIARNKEKLVLNWSATYDNGFRRNLPQSGCMQYIALVPKTQVSARPQWANCEAVPQLLRSVRPPEEQWSID